MQSSTNNDSTTPTPTPTTTPPLISSSPSLSPQHPPAKPETDPVVPNPETDNTIAEAGFGEEKPKKLTKKTLRIAKEGGGSASEGLVDVPVKEVISLDVGRGGSSAVALVVDAVAGGETKREVSVDNPSGRPRKLKIRKPSSEPIEGSPSLKRPKCKFCFQDFPTWKSMFEHLQSQHTTGAPPKPQPQQQQPQQRQPQEPQAEERQEVIDPTLEDKGEKKNGGEGSSEGNGGAVIDLNQQPMEGVEVSGDVKNQNDDVEEPVVVDGEGGDNAEGGHGHGGRKFPFDLNELPPEALDGDDN